MCQKVVYTTFFREMVNTGREPGSLDARGATFYIHLHRFTVHTTHLSGDLPDMPDRDTPIPRGAPPRPTRFNIHTEIPIRDSVLSDGSRPARLTAQKRVSRVDQPGLGLAWACSRLSSNFSLSVARTTRWTLDTVPVAVRVPVAGFLGGGRGMHGLRHQGAWVASKLAGGPPWPRLLVVDVLVH